MEWLEDWLKKIKETDLNKTYLEPPIEKAEGEEFIDVLPEDLRLVYSVYCKLCIEANIRSFRIAERLMKKFDGKKTSELLPEERRFIGTQKAILGRYEVFRQAFCQQVVETFPQTLLDPRQIEVRKGWKVVYLKREPEKSVFSFFR